MNNCVLMAEIVTAPQLRYTPEQTEVGEMGVEFPGVKEDDPAQKLKVVAWGKVAQEMQNHALGDRVVIEGRLQMTTKVLSDGATKQKYAELVAQRIHNLGSANGETAIAPTTPTPTAAPTPTATPTPTTKTKPPQTTPKATPKKQTPAKAAAPASVPAADPETEDIPF